MVLSNSVLSVIMARDKKQQCEYRMMRVTEQYVALDHLLNFSGSLVILNIR